MGLSSISTIRSLRRIGGGSGRGESKLDGLLPKLVLRQRRDLGHLRAVGALGGGGMRGQTGIVVYAEGHTAVGV